jgi:hypothetical protein
MSCLLSSAGEAPAPYFTCDFGIPGKRSPAFVCAALDVRSFPIRKHKVRHLIGATRQVRKCAKLRF